MLMKNNKSYIFIVCLLFFSSATTNSLIAQNKINEEKKSIELAITHGLDKYLAKIPIGHEYMYGFNSREEFNDLKVHNPRKYIIIDNESLESDYSKEAFYELDRWLVPITLKGEIVCFLEIKKNKDGYKAVGFGLNELASDYYSFEIKNEKLKLKKQYVFINYEKNCYCNVEKESGDFLFYPIRSLEHTNNRKGEKIFYNSKEMFQILKNI